MLGLIDFHAKFYETFKKWIIPIFKQKHFQKLEEEQLSPNSYESGITLPPKQTLWYFHIKKARDKNPL